MVSAFGTTHNGVPIAGWMVQANPAIFDIGSALARASEIDEWTWSCRPSYRVELMAEGQACFLWVTQNPNARLVSGIWLVGTILGKPYVTSGESAKLWRDVARRDQRRPYVRLLMGALARPVRREELLAHPVLRHLEVLAVPRTSNPQIVTPAQLEALSEDFDLSTAPLDDSLRDELWRPTGPQLWLQGPSGTDIEVDAEADDDWVVCEQQERIAQFATRREAYEFAGERAPRDGPMSSDAEGWTALATIHDGLISVYRVGPADYSVWVDVDGHEVEWEDRYGSLQEALHAIGDDFDNV